MSIEIHNQVTRSFVLFRKTLGRLAICALLVAIATKADVRADTGAMLRGTVVDSAGGALAGVALALINAAQGTQRETLTTRDGTFAFAMLAPGRYTLRADHPNFAPAEIRDLDLVAGVPITITIALQVARVRETVAVRGQLSSLASGTGGVGIVIDHESIERLPANGRAVQSLIALTPGVITTSGTDASGGFSVNGQRPSANYFMVDGVGANIANAVNAPSRSSQASGGALPGVTTLGTTASLTPYEALEEVRVHTSSYAAEYGRQPGAQVSLVTRAGDSTWRGSLSTQIRHEAFNASDWFANRAGWSRLPMRQEQFGGMMGGPLALFDRREDRRTFVLIAHEHVSLRSPQRLETWVPALSLRQQALSGARLLLDAFPRPDASAPTDGVANMIAADDDAQYRVDTTSVRVDHRINHTLSLFGRLNIAPSSSEAWKPTNLATRHREHLSATMLTVGATHQWRRVATDLRINLSANRGDIDEWQTDHLGAIPVPRTQLIPAGLVEGDTSAAVAFSFLNKGGLAPSVSESSSSTGQRQINIVGTTTVALDRHRIKLGIDLRLLRARLPPRDYDLFVNVATPMLVTSSDFGSAGTISTQPTDVRPRFTNVSAFAQDTWNVSSRVTFDVGVRWELNPPPGEAHNRLPYTGLLPFDGPSLEVAPAGTPLWRTSAGNLAPRAGAAWVLREAPGSETTLRAGGGLFYDLGNTQATRGYEGYHYRRTQYVGLTFPGDASTGVTIVPASRLWDGPLFAFDPQLHMPYTGQWNLSMEQALGATRRLTVSYVGAAGRRQLAQLQRESNNMMPNPDPFQSWYVTSNDGSSDYHALEWQFQQRLSSGLQLSVGHTWSHAIDRVSAESRAETISSTMVRADADFDVRHVMTATVGYDLPRLTSGRIGRALLDNWGFDGRVVMQSGRPLSVFSLNNLFDMNGIEQTKWALRVDGMPLTVDDPRAPGGWRINPQAFNQEPGIGSQTTGRNLVRGPGVWQVDLALRRMFALGDAARLTLQVNAFNALNRPNFGSIDPYLTSPTFGQARTMFGRTLGGLNASYQIGGPRTLEFSMRVSF